MRGAAVEAKGGAVGAVAGREVQHWMQGLTRQGGQPTFYKDSL